MPAKPTTIYGQALQLKQAVDRDVSRTHKPVPIDTIRYFAQIVSVLPTSDEHHCEFTERHYRIYANWYSEFTFADGSGIQFGHGED